MAEKWVEVFRAGKYPQGEFTETDLDGIVTRYNPQDHEAPLVKGHPEHDSPAYGWVEKMKREGRSLLASFRDVSPQVQEWHDTGAYKKRSAAFYRVPDGWCLRHVGVLGAMPPQVKGLADAKFSESANEGVIEIEFTENIAGMESQEATMPENNENEKLKAEFAEEKKSLEAKLAEAEKRSLEYEEKVKFAERELRRKDIDAKLAAYVLAGKVTPAQREDGLADFMSTLDAHVEVQFAEKKETPAAFMWRFLESLPPQVQFGESCTKDRAKKPEAEEEKSTVAAMAEGSRRMK